MTKGLYIQKVFYLLEHAYRYYHLDDPAISDYEYDMAYKEVKDYEELHPENLINISPTQFVGWGVSVNDN